MTRGQNGALLLSCAALSSATPYRFIPALSLITLSPLTSTFGGIVRPICFAAFRLITSSNFVGCSTESCSVNSNPGSLRRPDEIRFPRHLFGRTRRQQKRPLNTRERGIKRGGVVKIPVDKLDV